MDILRLYKKFIIENRKIIGLFLLICIIISGIAQVIASRSLILQWEKFSSTHIIQGKALVPKDPTIGQYDLEIDDNRVGLNFTSLLLFGAICFYPIAVHWGIRNFNYSDQMHHYLSLPLSMRTRFLFLFSYSFLIVPLLIVLIFSIPFIIIYPIYNNYGLYAYTTEMLESIFSLSNGRSEERFWEVNGVYGLILFILVSLQFRKMGFIKTIAAYFVLFLAWLGSFNYLNYTVFNTRFGDRNTLLINSSAYGLHWLIMCSIALITLCAIYLKLRDKNY